MNSNSNNSENSTKYVHDSKGNIAFGINKIFVDSQDNNQNCEIIDIYDKPAEQISIVDSQKYFATIFLNSKPTVFEVNSGAGFTLLPEDSFQKLNLKILLSPTKICFRAYTNDMFLPKDKAIVEVSYKGRKSSEEIYIVPKGRPAILSRIWIRHLKINFENVNTDMQIDSQISTPESIHTINDLFTQYSKVFEQ